MNEKKNASTHARKRKKKIKERKDICKCKRNYVMLIKQQRSSGQVTSVKDKRHNNNAIHDHICIRIHVYGKIYKARTK